MVPLRAAMAHGPVWGEVGRGIATGAAVGTVVVMDPARSADDHGPTRRYAKQRIALRYWLAGAGYHLAAEALAFAEAHHRGTRKDGVTPELSHQVAIVSYLRTLVPHLAQPEWTLAVGLLHDVREDYEVADAEISSRFGPEVARAVDAMTKCFAGVARPEAEVFAAIGADPMASVAKAADRIHNQHTMVGVFSPEKVASYVAETRQWFLPMLKTARRRFPRQEAAYENAKLVLESQLVLLDAVVAATAAGAAR